MDHGDDRPTRFQGDLLAFFAPGSPRTALIRTLSPRRFARIKPVTDRAVHEFRRVVMNVVVGVGDHDERAVLRDVVPHA